MQPGYKNEIWYSKMCHAYNEKWKKRNNRMNRTAKSWKYQKTWGEENFQAPLKIGNGHHETNRDNKKKKEKISSEEENFSKQSLATEITLKK